jgi:hypothetical protein
VGFFRERPSLDPLALGVLAFASAALVGIMAGLPIPAVHDEFVYLLMGETFARGRLTNPTPAFWEHLEAYHVLMTPSYMGKYPPVQGLFIALGILLGHPILGIWISCGLMVGSVTWMLQVWLGRSWALAGGGLILLNVGIGSTWAQGYWGGALAAAGGALVFGAARRGWEAPGWRPGLVLALGLLLLANSRPFEGLLLSIPTLGLVAAITFRSRPEWEGRWRMLGVLALLMAAGGMAMGRYHQAVTGSPFRMPYQEYHAQYAATSNLLLTPPRDPLPTYRHQEFRDYWIEYDLQRLQGWSTPLGFLGTRALLLLIAAGLLGPVVFGLLFLKPVLRDPWIRFTLASAVFTLCGWMLTKGAYRHYLAPALPALLLLSLEGWRQLASVYLPGVAGRRVLATVATLALWTGAFHLFLFANKEEPLAQIRRAELAECLEALPFGSLVLVEYSGVLIHRADWIRNAPDPGSSKVVWARSMGPDEDSQIMEGNPGRAVWRVVTDPHGSGEQDRFASLVRYPVGFSPTRVEGAPTCR